MNLTPEEWQQLSKLLDEALDLPVVERDAWLGGCGDLPAHLRPVLREMLAQSMEEVTLPPLPSYADSDPVLAPDGAAGLAPDSQIGPYRLIREIGRGGMGAVWLAERSDGALKRQVALKLPHSSLPQRQLAERFARERDILAGLVHPHIARLYDAGLSAQGQPFLALEYVEGQPLTDYCRDQKLDLPARLTLFLQVLRAIQYAHSQLVVHRDLKPNNILVTHEGYVRLLDFGIAKILTDGAAKETELTQLGGRALTPQYAAPEQILGQPVGTAVDVYGLGIVLYELLTGRLPYRLKRDTRIALEDAILSADAMPPSQTAKDSAEAAGWAKRLKGDLDTIVQKALKKDPADRYATAAAFADDINRYLNGEAVEAQPDSSWYRGRKFLIRHRLAVTATALVVVALATGMGVALWQARVAREEARTAKAVEEFVTGIFLANAAQQPDPVKARESTARQLLDMGAAKLDTTLADAPKAKARMLKIFTTLYSNVGLDEKASEFASRAVSIAREVHGPDATETVDALLAAYFYTTDPRSGVSKRGQFLDEAQAILERSSDRNSVAYGKFLTMSSRYWADRDFQRALVEAKQAVAILRNTADGFEALMSGAAILQQLGDYATAREWATEGVAMAGRFATQAGKEDVGNEVLPFFHQILGEIAWSLNDFRVAEGELRSSVGWAAKVYGQQDPNTIGMTARLAELLSAMGRLDEAGRLLADCRTLLENRPAGESSWLLRQTHIDLGRALLAAGKFGEARDHLAGIAGIRPYDGSPVLASYLRVQASTLIALGQRAEAEQILSRATSMRERAGVRPWNVLREEAMIRARLLLAEKKPAEAARLLGEFASEPYGFSPTGGQLQALRVEAALAQGDYGAAQAIASDSLAAIEASPQRTYLSLGEAALRNLMKQAQAPSGGRFAAITP